MASIVEKTESRFSVLFLIEIKLFCQPNLTWQINNI